MDHRREFVVEPGSKVRLDAVDPSYKGKHASHKSAASEIDEAVHRMDQLQYLLFADGGQSLLIVLQALDAGGKDGVIRHLFSGTNPQGTSVASFKEPSKVELAHDFLWRVHLCAPARGEVVIYNRSHYEDVLVVRVHELMPQTVWSRRYELINDYEKMLVANGTRIREWKRTGGHAVGRSRRLSFAIIIDPFGRAAVTSRVPLRTAARTCKR